MPLCLLILNQQDNGKNVIPRYGDFLSSFTVFFLRLSEVFLRHALRIFTIESKKKEKEQ